tara:strand:+ start:266096 stop:266587 length:492 start_codon:yes stop_codon:yes gene_type:complete
MIFDYYLCKKFKVKFLLYILSFCFSLTVSSQDFESRFYTIDDSSLPPLLQLDQSNFVKRFDKVSFTPTLGISSGNYWKPVSMIDALNQQEAYLNRKNEDTKPSITAETLGFKKVTEKESRIQVEVRDPYFTRRNRAHNSVYRDASLPFFYSPFYQRGVPGTDF